MSEDNQKLKKISGMSTPQPMLMNGNLAIQWKKWVQSFKFYLRASGMDEESYSRKVALFLHVIGEKGVDIFNTFGKNEDTVKYDELLQLFQNHFAPKANITYECHSFFTYRQGENETLDDFVCTLKLRSQNCELGQLQEHLVKVMFICNMHQKYNYIREKLLLEDKLDLDKALEMAKAMLASRHQTDELAAEQSSVLYNKSQSRSVSQYGQKFTNKACTRCGQMHRYKCPASNVNCNKCGKVGHFAVCCRSIKSKSVKYVQSDSDVQQAQGGQDELFIGHIQSSMSSNDWKITLCIKNSLINCIIDTGSDVNIMSKSVFDSLNIKNEMTKANVKIRSYTGNTLEVLGQQNLQCKFQFNNSYVTKQINFIIANVQERLQNININSVTSEMTPNCFALGYDSMADFVSDVHGCGEDMDFDLEHATRLLIGALVVSEIRAAVYNETGYRCSAGIAHNKILAKLVCGMNKPDKQTVLPKHSVNTLYQTLPIKKVKHLGGKFGDTVCAVLRIKHMAELQQFSERDLQAKFDEKNGSWLYNIARGIDTEAVQARYNPKSIGCCKQFKGKSALRDLHSLIRWLKDLGEEIDDRLEKDALENNRSPRQMVVSYSVEVDRDISSSRSYNFGTDDDLCGELFSSKALELVLDGMEGSKYEDGEGNRQLKYPIKFLGISVGKFENHSESKKTKKIKDYFAAGPSKEVQCDSKEPKEVFTKIEKNASSKSGKDEIMRKFLQKNESKDLKNDRINPSSESNHKPHLESLLDKQESFFAKFLNKENIEGGLNQLPASSRGQNNVTNSSEEAEITTDEVKVAGGVDTCKDDSNDTYCSGSTIDEEINKSIALFEEDADGVDRVSKMRQLLSSTGKENDIQTVETKEPHQDEQPHHSKQESYECSECGKMIAMDALDVHSDYHLALKLRDEYRQQARNEIKEKSILKEVVDRDTKKKKPTETTKPQTISSITNFLTKVDTTVPTKICSECGKRIANDKFMEHLDYHEAQKLSRQINNRVANIVSKTTGSGSSVKRKRKSESPTKKPKVPCKSINSFFKS